jgi:WD40 repeat protein
VIRFASACLLVVLLAATTQTHQASAQITSASPVAFVYVSANPNNSSTNEISAFAAAPNGKLTPITGSPFADDVTSMAVNGKYLFASTRNGIYVAAFAIESDGALRWTHSTDVVEYNQDDCGSSGPLFLDHTGASLYDMELDGNNCANNSYQSFAVNKFSGRLQNLGSGAAAIWFYLPATFIGNNVYAYTATCLYNMYWEISGFKRASDGRLNQININAPLPAAKPGDFWCPSQTAADPTNHVAITLQPVNASSFSPDGPAQLATFTADAAGNLHTTGNRANMPATSVGSVDAIGMSPSGKLLAVGGSAGLQVFHFNGASQLTHYTGLLITKPIDQFFWDNANHLYAISQSAGKLYVFTITPTSATQAAGSPYSIAHPQNIIVQPK